MSVARAETDLAAVLLIELMIAVAEEDAREGDEPNTAVSPDAAPEPAATAA